MSRPPKRPSHRKPKLVRARTRRAGNAGDQRSEDGRLVAPANMAMVKEAVEHFTSQSTKRSRTILLVEGTNHLTGRPVRVYIKPDDTLIACETLGQMERTK